MKKQGIIIITTVFLLSCLYHCKSNKQENQADKQLTEVVNNDSPNKIIYVLPSPNEVLGEIFMESIEVDPSFINSHSNAEKYLETRTQAVNLGVYIADFAYLSFTHDQTSELEYLKVIKDLSEKINLYGLMEENTIERIQNNLMEKDSLNKISQELYYKISDKLENSNRQNIFTLISSGAIIESLYLSVLNIDNFDKYKVIIQRMYEQKFVFDNFYEYAMQYSDDIYVREILDQLEILKNTFESIDKNEIDEKVVKEDDNLRFEGGTEFIVNKETFDNFKTNIISVRNEIVAQ